MVVERIKIEMCSSKLLELAKSIPDHADAITALAASIMQQEECFKSVCAALYRAMEELESAKKSHGHGHGSTAGGSSAALTKLRSEYVTVRERLDTTTAELKTAHRREAELRKLVDTATNELKAATQREKELRKRVDTQIHTHRRRKRNSFSAPQATTVETELVDRPAPHDTSKDTALTRPAAETKPADQPAPHDTPEETSLQEKTLEVSTHQDATRVITALSDELASVRGDLAAARVDVKNAYADLHAAHRRYERLRTFQVDQHHDAAGRVQHAFSYTPVGVFAPMPFAYTLAPASAWP